MRVLIAALSMATAGCSLCARAWSLQPQLQPQRPQRPQRCHGGAQAQPRCSSAPPPAPGGAGLATGAGLGAALAALVAVAAGARGRGRGRSGTSARDVRLLALPSRSEALEEAEAEVPDEEVETVELETVELGSSAPAPLLERRQLVQTAGALALASKAPLASAEVDPSWVLYDLNTGETLYDVDFDSKDPNHGFVVGARGLFYETKDGGRRWVSRSFANLSKGEDVSYRFQAVSVNGDDVWILGKPPLLLHSKDSGKSWKKVPVSRKLPGEPKVLVALGEGKAEMATSSGAVYVTENDGKNWKALVNETVDATLNRVSSSGVSGASYFTGSVKSIKRAPSGKYLAVAQRGNFYLTYNPGDERWLPHNRISARRIQAMGFRDASDGEPWDGVWMSLNGGSLTQTTQKGYDELGVETKDLFNYSEIRTGGIGIIDIAFRTPDEAWAVGGSGVIYVSNDGGKNWQFDSSAVDLPCNLYNVKFFDNGKIGYMIGSGGILLRKVFAA